MGRKPRDRAGRMADPAAAAPAGSQPRSTGSAVPDEGSGSGRAAGLLAAMIFLAPAIGVPGELMLQDTLKSIVVAFCALGAALVFFLGQAGRRTPLRWHALLWLPLLLMAYALGSMAWSHAYLAGVEAIRWFLFAVIAWLGLNTFTRERLAWIAWTAHAGALVASLWTALQFWFDLQLFPQGPNPASTFINRNFFAEFAVCTLPFAALLLVRLRRPGAIAALAASIGFVVTAILMTGTRSALMAMWMLLLVVLPVAAWRCRGQIAAASWSRAAKRMALGVALGTVVVLGVLPSGNAKIVEEGHGATALRRGVYRTGSIGPKDYSLGIRMIMWRATLTMIEARPLSGVGAGAWENDIPLYQAEGSQLETDYYAHNEFLQLVAEYGVVGWIFLLALAAYLLQALWRTWRAEGPQAQADRPWRAAILASLFALMVVSNIGFPWRLASTGALFALCLGGLAASDARMEAAWLPRPLQWSPWLSRAGVAASVACLALALYITQRAANAERDLVSAAKMALAITASGDWNDPRAAPEKREMLESVRAGIALNRHYRKITPMVADELARWGDWSDATWIWESVLSSRPYVVAILTNVARGYSTLGQPAKAMEYMRRARKLQPDAPAVRSLEVVLLARGGEEAKALALARESFAQGIEDYDLVNALFILAWRAHDVPTAERAMRERLARFPESRVQGYLQLGTMYAGEAHDDARALEAFRQGWLATPVAERGAYVRQVPPAFRGRVGMAGP